MAAFAVGDVVLVEYPYTDLSRTKCRPALIVAVDNNDFLLAMITSSQYGDNFAIKIPNKELKTSNLEVVSWTRVRRIFTGSNKIIKKKIGSFSSAFTLEAKKAIADWVSS